MRANDDIHRARRQLPHHPVLLALRAEPRQQFHPDRVIRHALAKIIVMLLRQHRRGHQNRHLLPVHHTFERRANRHLRLAKSHVAANQPVHRLGPLHVRLGFRNGRHLIARLLVNKSAFKFALPLRIRLAGVAGLGIAHRLDA